MNCLPTNVNGLYGPFGINDNNFNRQVFPSNNFIKGGANSGEPNNQFDPITTTSNSYANFENAFPTPKPILEKLDFTNKNNVIHNNLGPNILDEHIVEYRIMIDSIDRDIKVYPDPFSYVVKFNPVGASSIRTPNNEFIKYDGAPRPHINKEFINIKYVKLENIILPQYSGLKEKKGEYVFDPKSIIVTNMYNSLIIEELNNERIYTTSEVAPVPFALFIPDKLIGLTYYSGTPYYGSKIYKNSLLGNITQLHIQFADAEGKPLRMDNLYDYDDLQQHEYDTGEQFPVTDMRHPLNKRIQNHISLIFGVVECQINTNTKFDS